MISVGGFPASFHIEIGPVFLVGETGKPQNPRRIGGGGVSTEFAGHGMEKSFCLVESHAVDLPSDLKFCGRTGQNIIRFWYSSGVLNGFEGPRPALIQVEIDMADGFDVFLGPRR